MEKSKKAQLGLAIFQPLVFLGILIWMEDSKLKILLLISFVVILVPINILLSTKLNKGKEVSRSSFLVQLIAISVFLVVTVFGFIH